MSMNDSTPASPNENTDADDRDSAESTDQRDDTMILEVVAADTPPLFRPPAAEGAAADAASVPLTPAPATQEPPAPVRVAELTPAETGVEAPRTRWAAVVWGLFFAAVAIGGLWLVSEPSRPTATVERAFTVDAATGIAILILGLGIVLLVAGAAGLLRRTQRRRTAD
ncbi:hypothetical protein [Microbacterium schleiferi]|uniref:hypothetical protein n=1 Tax=Microbacterium schleiferi TaxID=69362 RepID=UPI001E43D220|nr:hypothetical protein [Microbacterium schleiferi]